MNNQKPEPFDPSSGSYLDMHSMFFTLQGEGPFAGCRSIFIRLAGCNLQCPGCDTEYTEGRSKVLTESILISVQELCQINLCHGCLIVITGGEPFRQNLGMLIDGLNMLGHHVQIESNGVLPPDQTTETILREGGATLVLSPKTWRVHPLSASLASAFKYVLDHRSIGDDGLPILALGHPAKGGVARPPQGKVIYINPFDAGNREDNKRNLIAATESALKFGYMLGIQLHKYLGLE